MYSGKVQEGMGPLDVDFSSIMIDGRGLNDDILQRKLQNIARQREELQHMEIELRAQAIARGEILEAQSGFEARMKEQDAAAAKLKVSSTNCSLLCPPFFLFLFLLAITQKPDY